MSPSEIALRLVVVVYLSLLLSACGGSSEGGSIIGTWKDNADGNTILTFTSNGLQMNDGESAPYTYEGNQLTATVSDGSTVAYTVEVNGDALTLTEDTGNVYKFTKFE